MATQTRPVTPPVTPEFKPYVPATQSPAELTIRAVILGAILGIVFAASSVYLALKIGLTVSASIPIAVLAVAFFRTLGKSTILENNIVQTTGSASESIVARTGGAGLEGRRRSPSSSNTSLLDLHLSALQREERELRQ